MTSQQPEPGKSIGKLFIKSTIWNTAGLAIYLICQWLITILVVWQYDDYVNAGYLGLAVGLTSFFVNIAQYTMRAFQASDTNGEFTDSDYVSSRVLTCILSVLLCAAFVFIFDYSVIQRYVILCYMLFRAIEAFIDVLHGIVQKHWRMDYIGISFFSRALLMLAAFTLLGWLYGILPSILGMVATSAAVAVFYDIPKARSLTKIMIGFKKPVMLLLKRCFPLMIVGVAGVFIQSFTRYSVEEIHGTEALGGYASVAAPAAAIQALAMFMFNPLINLFTIYLNESKKRQFIRLFLIVCAAVTGFSLVFIVAAYFFGEWGLVILFSESIIPYAFLFSGVAVSAALTVMIWYLTIIFSIVRDIRGLLSGTLLGAVISILTTAFFLKEFGLDGANIAMITSMGTAVLFLLVRFFTNKKIWTTIPTSSRET